MELSLAHVNTLIEKGASTLARFLLPNFQETSHVFVSYVAPSCDDYDTISPGMLLDKVNGKAVRTLQDFRDAFVPEGTDIFTFETDQQVLFATNFKAKMEAQLAAAKHGATYLLTPAVKAAANSSR